MSGEEWFKEVKARWDSEFMHELRWFLLVALIAAFAWSYKTEGANLCKVGCEMNATLSGSSYAGFAQGLYGECRCYVGKPAFRNEYNWGLVNYTVNSTFVKPYPTP